MLVGKNFHVVVMNTERDVLVGFYAKMLFITINTDKEDHKRILEFFDITDEELPTFREIQLGEDMANIKSDDDTIELENMKAFVAKFLAGELKHKQHLMSEESSKDWDKEEVKVLVPATQGRAARGHGSTGAHRSPAPTAWCATGTRHPRPSAPQRYGAQSSVSPKPMTPQATAPRLARPPPPSSSFYASTSPRLRARGRLPSQSYS